MRNTFLQLLVCCVTATVMKMLCADDGYAYRVQYLESSGTQYIDTGVVPTQKTTFKGMYEYMRVIGEKANNDMIVGLQGVGTSSIGRYYPVSLHNNTDTNPKRERYVLGGKQCEKTHSNLTRHSIIFNDANHDVYLDGVKLGTLTGVLAEQSRTCYLFAASKSNRSPGYHSIARIYSCEFIDNNGEEPVVLRRFIPVVDMDGRPAMFDEVEKKLYHNQADGDDFKAGPSAESWNDAPYFVEYVESDGHQWIDTGYKVTTNTETRAGYRYTEAAQANYAMICGITGLKYYPVSVNGASALKERHCLGSGNQFNSNHATLQNHEIIFNRDKNVFVDGKWLGRFNQGFNDSNYSMYIFAGNDNGSAKYKSMARVRYLKMYESGVLQKSLVPAVDANGVACMCDIKAQSNPYHYNLSEKHADDATKERYPFRIGRIISHAVSLDLSAKTDFVRGRNVLPFSERPSYGTVFTLDDKTAAEYDLAVREGGVWLVEKSEDEPMTAVWTGGGIAGDVKDSANWQCKNAEGEILAGVLPGERTVVTVTGETGIPLAADAMPNCASIVLAGTITLSADCDWRGLGKVVIPDGVTIDLNGHKLQLAGFETLGDDETTITDSTSNKGELHVFVGEDDVLVNNSVALTGSLKFVKAGAGVFVAQRHVQTYNGGTEVAAGILRRGDENGRYDRIKDLGSQTQSFRIASGAMFDINGAHTYDFIYTLDGGTLANGRENSANGNRYVGETIAILDSSSVSGENFGLIRSGWNEIIVYLNGNTLNVDMNSDSQFWLGHTTFSGAGTLAVNSGTLQTLRSYTNVGSEMTLKVGPSGKMSLDAPLTVKDFQSESSSYGGTNFITVLGTFKPSGNGLSGFPKMIFADGATIDVSELESALAFGDKVSFAEGATIKVNLGDRKLTANVPVVSWEGTPKNLSTVHFVDASGEQRIKRRSNGVYQSDSLKVIFR